MLIIKNLILNLTIWFSNISIQTWFITGLLLLSIVLVYIIVNLYRKVNALIAILNMAYNLTIETWHNMQEIDSKGTFQTDDEVEAVFNGLKRIISIYFSEISKLYGISKNENKNKNEK